MNQSDDMDQSLPVEFIELFDIDELQKLQDQFADAFAIASIITDLNGKPITRPSNFSRLCRNIIRCTEKGLKNCMHSDAVIGRHNPDGPVVQPCLSGGLWDAGASITVEGKHVANWLIGQVRNDVQQEEKMVEYAREIGADETDFLEAFREIPTMSQEQFHKISELLFTMANQLSEKAFQNLQQAKIIGERKKAEEALREEEEKFRTTLYSIGDGVITTDKEGRIRLMNHLAEQLTGWNQDEAQGKELEKVFAIINEVTRRKVEIPVRRVLREGVIVGLANHTLLIAKDGTERPIADSGAPIRNSNGEITGVVLVFRDQTEERMAEKALRESEEKFRSIVESSPYGIHLYHLNDDGDLIFLQGNESADRMLGLDHQKIKGLNIEQAFPNLTETSIPTLYKSIAKGESELTSFVVPYDDGNIHGIYDVTVFKSGDKKVSVNFIDVTIQKAAERSLLESEEKFRSLFENAAVGISMTQMDGTMQINHRLHEMLGYTEAEFKSKKWQEITHPDDIQFSIDVVKLLTEGTERQINFQKRYLHKDGSIVWADVSTTLHRDDNHHPDFFITSINDITHQKEAEISLRRNERKFRALIENSSDGISLVDANGFEFYHSSSCQQIMGYSANERDGKSMMELIHPDDKEFVMNMFVAILKNPGKLALLPTRVKHNNGSWIWIEGVANNLLADPDIQAIVINFRDVTERKQVELKLQRSERELKRAQQITHIGSWYLNLANNEVFWTEELYKMYGFDPTLPVPPYTEHMKLFTPESWELLSKSLANTAETGIPYELELKTVRKDGGNGWMWVRGETVQDAFGNTVGLWGAAQDISERKNAEQALFESEEMMRNSQAVAHICSYSTTLNLNEIVKSTWRCSREFYNVFGIDKTYPHTIEGWAGFIHPDHLEEMVAYHEYVIKERIPFEHEYKIIRINDGAERWVYGTGKLEFDEKGNPIRMYGVIQDITERKLIEEALVQSEERYSLAVDAAEHGIWDWNTETNEVYFSKQWKNQIGYIDQEIKNDFSVWVDHLHPEDKEACLNEVQNYLNNPHEHFILEFRFRHKDGSYRWIHNKASSIKGKDGKVVRMIGAHTDITESKLVLQTLGESEKRYRTLFEQASDGIFIADSEGNYVDVNTYGCAMLGYSRDEILKLNIVDLLLPQEVEENPIRYKELRQNPSVTNKRNLICKDGTLLPVEISGKMLDDGRFQGIVRDVTERLKAEEAIRSERKLLRTLIDNLPVTIYVKDSNGRKVVANKADLEVIGVDTEAEVLGKTDLEIFAHEIGQRGYEDDLKIIQTQEPVINREEVFIDKNGSLRWLLTSKVPIIDQQGKATGIVGIGRDITEQKKANETIQKLSKSIEQSPSTIVITNVEGKIEYVNPKFCEITGYTQEEAIGQNPRILKSGEMPPEKYKELWDIIASGGVWRGEFHNRKKNGDLYWEWATMTSIKNEDGEIINYIAIKEDISLRKQMEADLIIAKERAEESDRLKSAFLANMSHEIRTPLNSIIGFSELLADSYFDDEQKNEFIQHIIINGNNLLNIISDIVDISKIEAGEITIRKTNINVNNFLTQIWNFHVHKVQEKKLRLDIACKCPNSGQHLYFQADPERLIQVFNNLISNALKFTTEGYIEVGCRALENSVEFHVKDTGIGIPPQYHTKIFDRFRQVDTSITRKYGGNGLGLAITQNLIELMGGRIWVESEPGKGSTFYFTLPIFKK